MADEKSNRTARVATPRTRDAVIAELQQHFAASHLELREFELRVERAENATTDADLARCIQDLPLLEAPATLVPAVVVATPRVSAILASSTRRGRWRVPREVHLRAILGSLEVDLCEAELGPGDTVIHVTAWLGSITITVPEGLAVECEGSAFLGTFDHVAKGAASRRDGRLVRILGRATLGSVEVMVRPRNTVLEGIKALLGGK